MYVRKTIDTFEVQGNYGYGHGWECLCAEMTRKAALANLRLYRENEPGVAFRIKTVRIPREEISDVAG